jgi:hypothetical protein
MKRFLFLLVVLAVPFVGRSQDVTAPLRQAFDNCSTIGISAFAKTLYPDDLAALKNADASLSILTKGLGANFGGEVVLTVDFSSRVKRCYCVLYFERRPLWICVDFYSINGRSFFLPLKASITPEDVLPASLTGIGR